MEAKHTRNYIYPSIGSKCFRIGLAKYFIWISLFATPNIAELVSIPIPFLVIEIPIPQQKSSMMEYQDSIIISTRISLPLYLSLSIIFVEKYAISP